MDSAIADWSGLPGHLLASIAEYLHTRLDTLRFRAVSTSFRSSIPPPRKPLSPRLQPKIPSPLALDYPGYLLLAEFTFYAIEPLTQVSDPLQTTCTWLVKLEELNSGGVRLEDPLFRLRLGKVTHKLQEFEKLPQSLNLFDYRVKEVAKAYRLELVAQDEGINRIKPVVFSKAALATSDDETDDGFVVMAIIQEGDQLGVWRTVDQKWTIIDMGYESFCDIIYHNEMFYAIMSTGLTITVDPRSLVVTEVASPQNNLNFGARFLVNSFKDLFLVVKKWVWKLQPNDVKVYKLDKEKSEWVQVVDGLNDRAFFLGEDCSFSLSAKEFSGCKGNSLYFKHDPFKVDGFYPGVDGGIFDMKDDVVARLRAFVGYSKIFWPPPAWLKK